MPLGLSTFSQNLFLVYSFHAALQEGHVSPAMLTALSCSVKVVRDLRQQLDKSYSFLSI